MAKTLRDLFKWVKEPRTRFSGVAPHVAENPSEKHLVFTNGPSGSGKTFKTASYVGGVLSGDTLNRGANASEEQVRSEASARNARWKKTKASLASMTPEQRAEWNKQNTTKPFPGFSPDRVVNADFEKKQFPKSVYDPNDTTGLRDVSGAKTKAELEARGPEHRAGIDSLVKGLGYGSVEQFARERLGNEEQYHRENEPGGLTHELARAYAERRFKMLVKGNKSFIVDQVGYFPMMKAYAEEALKNGFHVTTDAIHSPLAVNFENNSLRERSEPDAVMRDTYARSENGARQFADYAKAMQAEGHHVYHYDTDVATRDRVRGAHNRGWTDNGRPADWQAARQAVAGAV